jgi:enamine deaminase RidA (YjgF/YER057c/UK114 family)
MIRKESSAGVGYSVVDPNGVRHVFAAAAPRSGETLAEQAHDALRTIEAVTSEQGAGGSIVHQAVFLRDLADRDACREIINQFYGDELPATTYIMQPPCDGKLLAIEALGVGRGRGQVEIERLGERMVLTHHDGITWVHMGNVCLRTPFPGVYDRASHVFQALNEGLALRGYRFDQIIRTWLYLGDIVGPDGETQRYKELNRARTDYYEGIQFGRGMLPPNWDKPVYPASTGIGTEGKDLVVSCIALATERPDVRVIPLENPLQTAACDYEPRYGHKSPKFARAMAVVTGKYAATLISGTASITASDTLHCDDVEAQTRQTLDNIAALISEHNYSRYGYPGFGATLDDVALVRVYIKRQEDYEKTRRVCEARLGEVPTIYAVADVCRPELLVEIEGISFATRKS